MGPIPILGLICDRIVIGYKKLHSSVRPQSNLELLLSEVCYFGNEEVYLNWNNLFV